MQEEFLEEVKGKGLVAMVLVHDQVPDHRAITPNEGLGRTGLARDQAGHQRPVGIESSAVLSVRGRHDGFYYSLAFWCSDRWF